MRCYSLAVCAFALSACGGQSTPVTISQAGPIVSNQPRELLPDEQIQQVLNRLAFGARPGDAEKVRAIGVEKWIDLQLHPERIDNGKTEQLMSRYSIFATPTSDIVRDFQMVQQAQRQAKRAEANDSTMNKGAARRDVLARNPQLADAARQAQQLVGQVASAKLARAVTSERQLDEVMADFWENHFSVFAGKGQTRLFLPQYDRDVIRPRASLADATWPTSCCA
jgi:uncharacterized protein (DUF1800 family)